MPPVLNLNDRASHCKSCWDIYSKLNVREGFCVFFFSLTSGLLYNLFFLVSPWWSLCYLHRDGLIYFTRFLPPPPPKLLPGEDSLTSKAWATAEITCSLYGFSLPPFSLVWPEVRLPQACSRQEASVGCRQAKWFFPRGLSRCMSKTNQATARKRFKQDREMES